MPSALSHRIVLVGVEAALQPAVNAALAQRSARAAAVCAAVAAARAEVLAHPDPAHLFVAQLPAADLAALAAALPGQPILALLPPAASVQQVVEAQRAGAAQVVPLPLVADDLLRALDSIAQQFPPPAREATILAVCGVSGGCGATTLALNLAWELTRPGLAGVRGPQTGLLVELARQMGALATYLDIEPPRTTHDLLTDPSRLTTLGVRQALTTVAPGLDVLVGPYQDITPGTVSPRHVGQLVQLCRRMASLVVLDVPCTFDDLQFETLALADQVVLVGVQTVASIRALKMLRDTLEREEGIQGIRLVINRYEPTLEGFSAERLAELFGVPAVLTVGNDYPSVMVAVNNGKPLGVAMPLSRVLTDIRTLARALVGTTPAPPTPTPDRLARALGRKESAGPRALRVLHIEDDPVQQQAMKLHLSALKEFSFRVTTVVSETEAVEAFAREPFDVILLDYHLAQGNGLGCLKQLRAMDPIVPVMVVSGVGQPHIAVELLTAGADDFLSKENLSGQTLVRLVTEAVSRADGIKHRRTSTGAEVSQARQAMASPDEAELLRGLRELQQKTRTRQFSAGQIQRLVDLVASELDRSSPAAQGLPRKALLALFMRLFGGEAE